MVTNYTVIRTHCGNDPVEIPLSFERLDIIFGNSVKQAWSGTYLATAGATLDALKAGETVETQGWEWTLKR